MKQYVGLYGSQRETILMRDGIHDLASFSKLVHPDFFASTASRIP
jgi:hypothetical protein